MVMWTRGETLGRGASATVSLAVASSPSNDDHRLPLVMAVKSAPVHKSLLLRRESRLLAGFHGSPFILRCFGAEWTIERGELWYNILLEYAAGGSLADRVQSSSGGLPESEVKRYTKSILEGLKHIHKRGYVHCDIKPHNILLVERSELLSVPNLNSSQKRRKSNQERTAKIADFGLAMKSGQRVMKGRESERGVRGTPMYIAPESILRGEYEPSCDIWALGCTVLQMITGKEPWKCKKNTKKTAILSMIRFTELVPEIPIGLSKEARDFLRKCLVRDPESRWTTDMLLLHSFVSGFSESDEEERGSCVVPEVGEGDCDCDCDSSPHTWFDILPKPYLMMAHTKPDGVNSAEFLAGKILARKKMKTMEEEDEEEQRKSSTSIKLDALGRYWGIKRISKMPNSSAAIMIFN